MLTDSRVLVEKHRPLPALICEQRKAEKKLVTEADIVKANIAGFGDSIGAITNRITAMYDVQTQFTPDSREHQVLEYRIMC